MVCIDVDAFIFLFAIKIIIIIIIIIIPFAVYGAVIMTVTARVHPVHLTNNYIRGEFWHLRRLSKLFTDALNFSSEQFLN